MPGESGGGGQLCSIRSIWRVACSTIPHRLLGELWFLSGVVRSTAGLLLRTLCLAQALLQALGELLFFRAFWRASQQEGCEDGCCEELLAHASDEGR